MLRIEKVKVKDLYEFACAISNKLNSKDVIPITKHRALAYANNPYADEDDISLLVGYIEDRCIGYLGIMPGLLKVGNNFSKVYWFSTFFISPELRGKGFGSLLVKNAFLLNYDFVATPMHNTRSESVFRWAGMRDFAYLEYYVIDIRVLNFFTLPLRLSREILRKIGFESQIINLIVRIVDRICLPLIKDIFYGLLLRQPKRQKEIQKAISYQEADKILDEDFKQVEHNLRSVEFYRGVKAINWMLEYKWIKEIKNAEPVDFNYFFSSLRDIYKIIALKIYSRDDKEYKGFLILSFSSKNSHSVIKVLDFYIYDRYEYLAFLVSRFAIIYKASSIEFPDILAPYIKNSALLRLLAFKKKLIYLYYPKDKYSPLANFYTQIHLNYCDGDNAFF